MNRVVSNLLAVLLLCCCATAAQATRYPRGPSDNCLDSLLVINIQDPTQMCHPTSLSDTIFGLGGVVTGFDNKPTGFGFYIQNNRAGFANGAPWTGIDVFTHGTNFAAGLGIALGDSVVVEFGSVTEFNAGTEVLSPNNNFTTPNIILRKVAGSSAAHPIPTMHVGTTNELHELPTNPNGEQ
jgi:hypothetical protein